MNGKRLPRFSTPITHKYTYAHYGKHMYRLVVAFLRIIQYYLLLLLLLQHQSAEPRRLQEHPTVCLFSWDFSKKKHFKFQMRKISKINKNMLREAKKKNVRKINHINAHLFFIVQLHASNTSWWGKLLKHCCI